MSKERIPSIQEAAMRKCASTKAEKKTLVKRGSNDWKPLARSFFTCQDLNDSKNSFIQPEEPVTSERLGIKISTLVTLKWFLNDFFK